VRTDGEEIEKSRQKESAGASVYGRKRMGQQLAYIYGRKSEIVCLENLAIGIARENFRLKVISRAWKIFAARYDYNVEVD